MLKTVGKRRISSSLVRRFDGRGHYFYASDVPTDLAGLFNRVINRPELFDVLFQHVPGEVLSGNCFPNIDPFSQSELGCE